MRKKGKGLPIDRRAYRALGWATLLFVASAAFYLLDRRAPASAPQPPAPSASAGAQTSDFVEALKNYPPPSAFRTLAVSPKGAFDPEVTTLVGTCAGGYYAVVIFPAGADYRSDPSRAVVNRASACTPREAFSSVISSTTLPSMPPGKYYVILADQGATGLWYNPQ